MNQPSGLFTPNGSFILRLRPQGKVVSPLKRLMVTTAFTCHFKWQVIADIITLENLSNSIYQKDW